MVKLLNVWNKNISDMLKRHFLFPDKMCDQISDAILDAHLRQDPNAKVACGKWLSIDRLIILCDDRSMELKANSANYQQKRWLKPVWCFCAAKSHLKRMWITRKSWETLSSTSDTTTRPKVCNNILVLLVHTIDVVFTGIKPNAMSRQTIQNFVLPSGTK